MKCRRNVNQENEKEATTSVESGLWMGCCLLALLSLSLSVSSKGKQATIGLIWIYRQCADCAALILWYFDSAVIGCWCQLSCVRLIKRKMDDKGWRERAMNGPWGGGCSLSLNQADKVVTPRTPIHPHISSALNVCFSGEYSDEPRRRLFCPSKIMLGRLQDNVRFGEQKELATQHKNECLTRQVN